MNKLYFWRTFLLTDWRHMCCKNTIEIFSIYWNVIYGFFQVCHDIFSKSVNVPLANQNSVISCSRPKFYHFWSVETFARFEEEGS